MKGFFQKEWFFMLLLFSVSSIACSRSFAEVTNVNHRQSFVGYASPEQYYNEALSAEKNENDLEALLALRRALILDPTLKPAQEHLSALLEKMDLPIDTSWKARAANQLSPEMMMLIGTIIGWSAALFVVWLFFLRHVWTSKRNFFFCLSLVFFLIGHGITLFGFLIDPRVTAQRQVLLFPRQSALHSETPLAQIPLRTTPTDNAEVITQLPRGSLLTLLSPHGAWAYVCTNTGQQGWISSALMERLIPKQK
ncbi:MAG: SH3 domain-containing protein [Chthoniobacterales bacterium]